MLRILDWYILKRYLGTFFSLFLIFIPIAILANLAEKIDNIFEKKLAFLDVLIFYANFSIHFAYLLFPLLLFLSVIWFTSKLANKTEIIAILSSGVSYSRFLRPYIVGSTFVSLITLFGGMFVVPKANEAYNNFNHTYLKSSNRSLKSTENLYRQLDENQYIYAHEFSPQKKTATKFTLEYLEGNKLIHKISADKLTYVPKDSIYKLYKYVKRTVLDSSDIIVKKTVHDTVLSFDIDRLTPVKYVAETLNYFELKKFIVQEELRGSPNINSYKVEAYKRVSLPVAAYILTIIGVAVSSQKRRGGMGVNLIFGLVIAFAFVFFDKVFGTIATQPNSTLSPIFAVWFPNIVFAILAIYLLIKARR